MNLHEISAVVNKAAETIKANEKFALPSLAVKARKAAERYPNDTALVTASGVLTKMASKKTLITRAELNNVCNSLHCYGSKLTELFAEELAREEFKGAKTFQRYADEGTSLDREYEKIADPLLANALGAMLGSNEYKPYAKKDAESAQKACQRELTALGMAPQKVTIFAGKNDIMLCTAAYDTPKGICNVLVPVELKDGRALLPTMFLSKAGFADLTSENISQHIMETAGKSYKVNGEKLLEVLSNAKHGIKKIASTVEMAAIKIKAAKQSAAGDPNSIIGLKLEEVTPDVQLPQMPKTAEEETFAEKLSKPDGIARHLFSDRVVEAGRNMLVRKMGQLGYGGVQVKVAEVAEKSISYAVGIGNRGGMKVQVKVTGNLVEPPTFAVASGKIVSLTKAGIEAMLKESVDTRMLAAASPSYGLKPSELVQQVRDAVSEGNLARAEDAINVLGETDKEAQKTAIAILMQSLSPSDPDGEMNKIAKREVKDVPYLMTHKIFFPEGA